jgi:predicted metalloprotease with PDZ domain
VLISVIVPCRNEVAFIEAFVQAVLAQRLGLRVSEIGGSVQVKGVLRASAAETAGLAAGDEWLGLEVGAKGQGGCWRLSKLDDLGAVIGPARSCVSP